MSFVEGITTASVDVADPSFVLCLGWIALILTLLVATPAVAVVLRYLSVDRGAVKRICAFFASKRR